MFRSILIRLKVAVDVLELDVGGPFAPVIQGTLERLELITVFTDHALALLDP